MEIKKCRLILFSAATAAFLLMPACARKNNEKGEKALAAYTETLDDSIKNLKNEIDSCNSQITLLRENVGDLMSNFTNVANPREVGSYLIVTNWKSRYPLSSTGIVARIDDSNRFELVAALAGRAFDRITVQTPSESVSSAVVPNDQALNYRTPELTTVSFSGEEADAIGQLICDNALNPITVIFESSRPVQTWKMPLENSKMISLTYALYRDTKEMNRLERRVPMLHEKINVIRLHKDGK